jgi:hypothetical protein
MLNVESMDLNLKEKNRKSNEMRMGVRTLKK